VEGAGHALNYGLSTSSSSHGEPIDKDECHLIMAAALKGNGTSVSNSGICDPRAGILYLVRERGCG
jgi:hypothetical protein